MPGPSELYFHNFAPGCHCDATERKLLEIIIPPLHGLGDLILDLIFLFSFSVDGGSLGQVHFVHDSGLPAYQQVCLFCLTNMKCTSIHHLGM